jgi:hypothetical protein
MDGSMLLTRDKQQSWKEVKATTSVSNEFTGNLLDVHRNSVDHWLQSYKEKGMKGLTALRYKSRKSDLELYVDRVKAHFLDGYIQTVKEFFHKFYRYHFYRRGHCYGIFSPTQGRLRGQTGENRFG